MPEENQEVPKESRFRRWWKNWQDKTNPDARVYLLGAPFFGRKAQTALYAANLKQRFRFDPEKPPPTSKEGVDYISRAYDRLIGKSRGLLTFCALLFTSFNVIAPKLTEQAKASWLIHIAVVAASLLPLVASLPLLYLFWMNWGPPADYETNDKDFDALIGVTRNRTCVLSISVWLAGIEVVILCFLAYRWLA